MYELEKAKSKDDKIYYIERKIESIQVYKVIAKSCFDAKCIIDENQKNGELIDHKAIKTLRNVSGLYK